MIVCGGGSLSIGKKKSTLSFKYFVVLSAASKCIQKYVGHLYTLLMVKYVFIRFLNLSIDFSHINIRKMWEACTFKLLVTGLSTLWTHCWRDWDLQYTWYNNHFSSTGTLTH